jgi:signal transduction histidine kinase
METPKKESALEAENARLRGDLLTIASRVSHDLRTPLGGIVTTTEVLREMFAEKNQPVTLTQAVLDSCDDMTRLIRQISFITRATANTPPKKLVQMGPIVAMALQRAERKISKKGDTVTKPDDWPQVNGVPEWLEEIWWNFLINAAQHTPEKTRIELAWRQENGFYRFEISDNGPGVPDIIRPGLFHPFHSLHVPGSAKGLGLSIVQRLVDMQGGTCGYEPLPGSTRFFFSLPRG